MNTWGSGQAAKYLNTFSYDANGNITNQERRNENGALIDNLTYGYNKVNGKTVQNRLYHVDDAQANTAAFTDDIDDMSSLALGQTVNTANNYQYDQEGRLIRDDQEGIASIEWRVDGKVKKINRTAGSVKKNLIFEYDAMGHRIAKHVLTSANVLEKSTFYVLDAQGNAMAVYERAVNASNQSITFEHTEKHIYGSSRLGVMNVKVPMLGSQNTSYSMINKKHRIGERNYELSNHLGNVLSVVSDKPVPHPSSASGGGGTVDYYMADIMQSTDYSGFGVQLSGRNFLKANVSKDYRRGFQGQEEDDELKGEGNSLNYTYRMHDSRLGRFFAIDPLTQSYPELTPYQFSSNSVVFMIELEGMEGRVYYHNFNEKTGKANPKPGFSKEVEGLTENVAFTIHYKTNGDFDYADGRGTESGARPTFHSYGEMTNDKLLLLNFPNQDKQPDYINNQSNPGIDPTYYDSWEGGYDGGNTGGSLGGEHGWNNGGKQLFFGTIGLVTAPLTFAATTTWLGYTSATVGTLNNIDDVGGVFLPKTYNYQSLSQSLVTSQGAKDNISKAKGILNYSNFIGGSANTLVGLTKPMTLNGVSGGVNTLTESLQLKSSTEELKK